MSILSHIANLLGGTAFAGLLHRGRDDLAAPPPDRPAPPWIAADALAGMGTGLLRPPPVLPVPLYTTRMHETEALRRLFAPAQPMAGVVPEGVTPMALDDAQWFSQGYNPYSVYGNMALSDNLAWMGFPVLAELAQRPEFRRIAEGTAREMTRRWIKIQATGEEDKTPKIKALEAAVKKHQLQAKFKRLAELDGYMGRAHLYIDTGQTEEPDNLKVPLAVDPRVITQGGSLKGFRVVDPTWCYPNLYNSNDPLRHDYYVPSTWFVMGKEVHKSRLLLFVGREVPDLFKPAYSFGGLSLTQMAQPYVANFLRTRQSVSDLVHSFSTMVLQTNLGATLNAGSSEQMRLRATLFNFMRDNANLMVVDKTTEDFKNVSVPLGTIDALQAQAQEQQAAVVGMPLVILLGITPTGLNSTSEGELQAWAQFIHSAQTNFFDVNLTICLNILQLDLFGEIDPAISHSWEPLKQLDEKELAEAAKSKADTDAVYINAGVLSPDEIRQKLSGEADSPYQGLDLDEPAPTPPEAEGDPGAEGGEEPQGGPPPGGAPSPGGAGGPAGTAAPATGAKPVRGVLGKAIGGDSDESGYGEIIPFPSAGARDAAMWIAADAEWVETQHVRGKGGKFSRTYSKSSPPKHQPAGAPYQSWTPPADSAGWKAEADAGPHFDEPPLPPLKGGKKQAAGVIVQEPDGRTWIVRPTNSFGGAKATFPKGGVDKGDTPRSTAIKEAYEESGLHVQLTGYAGDVARGTSQARMYYAKRIGGTPSDHGWESEGVMLSPAEHLHQHLNLPIDRQLARHVIPDANNEAPLDVDNMKKTGGAQGSNPGGTYHDAGTGKDYYVKQSKSKEHARNEILASKLYEAAQSPVLHNMTARMPDGSLGTASEWQGKTPIDVGNVHDRRAAQENFATHAWLANWDAPGLTHDNQARIDGKMHTLDTGGSMLYRAQGDPKGNLFGDQAHEWETMRHPVPGVSSNKQAHELFGEMTPAQLQSSAHKVTRIPDHVIHGLAQRHGPGNTSMRKALAQRLINRRDDIAQRAGLASGKDAAPVLVGADEDPDAAAIERAFASIALDAMIGEAWEEHKHPRNDSGQFTSGGEGGGGGGGEAEEPEPEEAKAEPPKAHKAVPLPPKYAEKVGLKIKAEYEKAIGEAHDPHAVAGVLKGIAAGYADKDYAAYANKLLGHLAEHHGMAPGALGKAVPKAPGAKAAAAAPPVAAPTPPPPPVAAPPPPPPVAPPVAAPAPAMAIPPLPQGAPSSNIQMKMKDIAKSPFKTKAEKIKYINEAIGETYLSKNKIYGVELIQHINQYHPEGMTSKMGKPALVQAQPTAAQQQAYAGAQNAYAAQQALIAKTQAEQAAAIAAAAPPPPSFPKPGNPPMESGSTKQSQIQAFGESTANLADKIGAIQGIKANANPGGTTEAYANAWLAHLGDLGAMQAMAAKPAAPPPPAAAPAAAPKPQGNVISGAPSARMTDARRLEKVSIKPKSSDGADAEKAMPSLAPSFWEGGTVSAAAKKSIEFYGGSAYHSMNGILRDPATAKHNPAAMQHVDNIDDLFFRDEAIVKEPIQIMRGESPTPEHDLMGEIAGWEAGLKAGFPPTILAHRKGYTSASASPHPAFAAKSVWFQFTAEKGSRVLGVAGEVGHHENEVLLKHGQEMEVFEIIRDHPTPYGKKTLVKAIIR